MRVHAGTHAYYVNITDQYFRSSFSISKTTYGNLSRLLYPIRPSRQFSAPIAPHHLADVSDTEADQTQILGRGLSRPSCPGLSRPGELICQTLRRFAPVVPPALVRARADIPRGQTPPYLLPASWPRWMGLHVVSRPSNGPPTRGTHLQPRSVYRTCLCA